MHPTAAAEKSDATKRAYRSDFEHFAGWCNSAGRTPLPGAAETVAAYLALLAEGGLKSSTIRRRCAGIAWAHRLEDLEPSDRGRAGEGRSAPEPPARGVARMTDRPPACKAPPQAQASPLSLVRLARFLFEPLRQFHVVGSNLAHRFLGVRVREGLGSGQDFVCACSQFAGDRQKVLIRH
jgi:hypothetical protein